MALEQAKASSRAVMPHSVMYYGLPKRKHNMVPCPASVNNPVREKKQSISSQNNGILVIKMRLLC